MNVLGGFDVGSFNQFAQLRVRAESADSGQRTSVNGTERDVRGPKGEHHAHRGHHGHRAQHGDRAENGATRIFEPADEKSRSMGLASESSVEISNRSSGKTSLYFKTQEGDTVRLKIESSESVKLSMSQQEDGDNLVKTLQFESGSSTQIKFSVKGDLNADELAAITNVIDQAGALAEEFFSGGLQSAFESASSLNIDGQQLAKVGLKMQVREQFTYSQQGLLSGVGTPTVTDNPDAAPAASDTAASAPLVPATSAAMEPSSAISPLAASRGDEVATPVPSVGSSSEVAAELAADFSAAAPVAATDDGTAAPRVTPASQTSPFPALMADTLASISDFLTKLVGTLDELQATTDDPAQPQDSGPAVSLSLKLKIFESVLISASMTTSVNEAQAPPAEAPDSADTDTATGLPALVSDTLDALAANQQPPVEVIA